MKRKVILISLLLVSLLLIACSNSPITEDVISENNDTDEVPAIDEVASKDDVPTVEELITDIVSANEELKSWRYRSDMYVDMESIGELTEHYEMSISSNGAVDLAAKKLQMDMDMSMDILCQTIETSATTYLIGNSIYVKTKTAASKDQWVKRELDDTEFEQICNMITGSMSTTTLVDCIEECNFEEITHGDLNGVECYFLEANPDIDNVLALAQGILQNIGSSEESSANISDMFPTISMKVWVDQKTHHILRSEIYFSIFMKRDDTHQVSGDMQIYASFYDYGESIDIQLPPEAEASTTTTN